MNATHTAHAFLLAPFFFPIFFKIWMFLGLFVLSSIAIVQIVTLTGMPEERVNRIFLFTVLAVSAATIFPNIGMILAILCLSIIGFYTGLAMVLRH